MALYYLNQYISKTLETVGGIDDSQTSDIELPDVTGLEIAKPGIACISYTDPIDTDNAEWISYTSINNTTKKFVGVTRGTEGFAAKAHDKGVVIAFPLSESHINNLNDALSIEDDPTDPVTTTLDEDDMASDSATALATQQSIKAYVDDNSGGSEDFMSRQALINGNFDVWQRGTSSTGSGYLADRWYTTRGSGNAGTTTRQSFTVGQTDVPNNPLYYYQHDRTTTASAVTTIDQRIEKVYSFANSNVTVSFWAKADASKNLDVYMKQYFGSGGSADVDTASQEASVTTSWTQFTFTFAVASISGKTVSGGDDSLRLVFSLHNDQGNSTMDIAQVQLCAGSTALDFMPRSYSQEYDDCLRYYYQVGGTQAGIYPPSSTWVRSGSEARTVFFFPKPMRDTNPTPTWGTVSGSNFQYLYDATGAAITTLTHIGSTRTSSVIRGNIASGFTAGDSAVMYIDSANAWFAWESEL